MDYIRVLRVPQWCKNFFVFLPLFFAQGITDTARLYTCIVTFAVMCMVSSCVYILNDICDVNHDSQHPEKCRRPIASGGIAIKNAWLLYGVLLVVAGGMVWCFVPDMTLVWVLIIYLILNHAYSLWLKHIAIVDVMVVASGFVLRIIAGAVAASVTPSHWIIIMTFLLALFLVMAKRRDDVLKYEKEAKSLRRNIRAYNRQFLDSSITLVATVTLVSYIMYTVDADVVKRFDCEYVYSTTIFVLAGILRYLQLTFVEEKSWSPTRIIARDVFMQCCVAGWLLLFAYIIYG